MKHPFYSVSIDDIPFGDRIIAILLRTYLVRCEDAEQKLAAILSEGIVLKLPSPVQDQEAIPLKTVLEGEHLANLIDEAVAFVKADQTDHSDSDIRASFVDQALLKKCGCIVANRYDSMVPYFAETIIRTKLILMYHNRCMRIFLPAALCVILYDTVRRSAGNGLSRAV